MSTMTHPAPKAAAMDCPDRPPTRRECILQVARTLPNSFTMEALIVAVWRAYPQHFGLAGYEVAYPDSNKLITYMVGERGLVAQGFFVKLAPKTFRVTRAAIEPLPPSPQVFEPLRIELKLFIDPLTQQTAIDAFRERCRIHGHVYGRAEAELLLRAAVGRIER